MIFVYDRRVEDVMRATLLHGKVESGGFDTLSTEEKAEWMAGLKGAYNVTTDLARVENNTGEIARFIREAGYPAPADTYHGWGFDSFPTQAQMERVRRNVEILRNALPVPEATPQVPSSLDKMDIQKANDIEKILYDVWLVAKSTQQNGRYVNTFYAGGAGQL